MSLTAVVEQMNNVRDQNDEERIDLHDFQQEEADQVFEFCEERLNETGYVKGRTTSSVGFGPSVEDEQVVYLSAVRDLLQQGFDTPNTVANF